MCMYITNGEGVIHAVSELVAKYSTGIFGFAYDVHGIQIFEVGRRQRGVLKERKLFESRSRNKEDPKIVCLPRVSTQPDPSLARNYPRRLVLAGLRKLRANMN